jgi:primosomal protein N'
MDISAASCLSSLGRELIAPQPFGAQPTGSFQGVARLRLKNPTIQSSRTYEGQRFVIDVAVSVPVPHLDGNYSYRTEGQQLQVGSVVRVPFGAGESFGFVVEIRELSENDLRFKPILAVIHARPLFSQYSLGRYQRIAELYGASLFGILSNAVPSWKTKSKPDEVESNPPSMSFDPSVIDKQFMDRTFGSAWNRQGEVHILLPIASRWDHVAVSICLADPKPTLILVPTERMLQTLIASLEERNFSSFVTISSYLKKSERENQLRRMMEYPQLLVIGTRGAALSPFEPKRVIIVDPGDVNYQDQRSPYIRSDQPEIWQGVPQRLTISHSRNLEVMAKGQKYLRGKEAGSHRFITTSIEDILSDLLRIIRRDQSLKTILISLNDKSFGTGLICSSCRNRSICECGFPLRVKKRGSIPECSKCLKVFERYRCKFCGGGELRATRGGSEALALSLAKSVRGSRVTISNTESPKEQIAATSSSHSIVIATHGLEPRILNDDGRFEGYDVVIMLGGRAAFSGSSLSRSDRFRVGWGRLLGLANPGNSVFLVDIESNHPELNELRRHQRGPGLELILKEREELRLPPFVLLVEMKGEDRVLHQLRAALLDDQLFQKVGNEIFPVRTGAMTMRVKSDDRIELLRLLQTVTRVRSAKRLSVVQYRVDPQEV